MISVASYTNTSGKRLTLPTCTCTLTSDLTSGVMPKRGLDVNTCEVFRFYRLIAIKDLVEPLSMIVPRKEVRMMSLIILYTDDQDNQNPFFPPVLLVRYFPRGSLSNDGWKPGSHDGSGVAVGDKQGSVTR